MSATRVLVVDDEESMRLVTRAMLERAGYRVAVAESGAAALPRLAEADIVLCDIRMPEMDGLAFLGALPSDAPPVVVMSAYGSHDTAIEAVRRGAFDYVNKPFTGEEIVLTLRKLEERQKLVAERAKLAVENAWLSERSGEEVEGFVGRSEAIRELLRVLARVAGRDTTVLLTGESGTGKEVLARAIHRLSHRAAGPWVAVNCAAIPEPLLESELFGHVRGAFTGAVRDHAGLFEQAHGGTLFLDEIGDLGPGVQGKLLRALEEGTVRRVGGSRDQRVDVRIVAATAQPLVTPRFREDLYYRLAVVALAIPPLRERADDIPLLVEHLLRNLARRLRLPVPLVDPEAMGRLVTHPWPGNVRQLENALERAMLVSEGVIRPEDLPVELRSSRSAEAPLPDDLSIPRVLAGVERELIKRALDRTAGNKAAASRLLEISYKALLYKIKEYELDA